MMSERPRRQVVMIRMIEQPMASGTQPPSKILRVFAEKNAKSLMPKAPNNAITAQRAQPN